MSEPDTRHLIRDLGDGLVLRRATPEDAEAMAEFQAEIHRTPDDKPDRSIAAWVRDLMTRPHPTFTPGDFTIVEETAERRIVSSLNLIDQTWAYEGIRFGVGRPELVATHPDYRRRGLVRLQMETVHRWSAEREQHMQVITGVPWYYRQFGYEMTLDLNGGRAGYRPHVPALEDEAAEPFTLRPATLADIPVIDAAYEMACREQTIYCPRDDALWRYDMEGRSDENVHRWVFRIIEGVPDQPVGYLVHPPRLWGGTLSVRFAGLLPGTSWLEVAPSVARYLKTTGEAYAERDDASWDAFSFGLGHQHPIYEALRGRLPRRVPGYAWYVRVPDVAGFLRHIGPALERRLADSWLAGYDGTLKLSFYRDGVQLQFGSGRLVDVSVWQPPDIEAGDAVFPELTFLQVLTGYRAFEEVAAFYPDCAARNAPARALIDVLFPRKASHIWPIA